jgi:hypothetical protein
MPIFEIQAPDGRTFQVDGPNIAGAMELVKNIPAATPEPDMLPDVAKSAGIGLAKGAIGLAGLPGDALNLGTKGVDYLAGTNYNEQLGQSIPGSERIQKAVESRTGEFYKPQTTAGSFAQTIGEFAPAALAGPGGVARRVAANVVAPAVASETAGQLTKGTDVEPYARVVGALAGGGVAGATANKLGAAREVVPPTADDIKKLASQQFEQARNMGLEIRPQSLSIMADDITRELKAAGFHPNDQPKVFGVVDRLKGVTTPTATLDDIETARKGLVNAKMSTDGAERAAARLATERLMQKQANLSPADVLQGDAEATTAVLKEAIANWAAGKRSDAVSGKLALGDLNAATAGAGGNIDNATRQAVKQLVRPVNNDVVPKASRMGFNAAEIEQMNKVARGTASGNIARFAGKLAPTGIVSAGLSGGGGFALGGPVGAVALPVMGTIAKAISDASTARQAAKLERMVRARSPMAAKMLAAMPPAQKQSLIAQAVINAALARQPAGILAPAMSSVGGF